MTDSTNKDLGNITNPEAQDEKTKKETTAGGLAEESQTSSASLRQASYIVLFIAAVFVVNAMETGSYRTPWPVAIITALAGFGLLGYSLHLQSRSQSKK
jgi:multidrug efflux pump subunit AcrB